MGTRVLIVSADTRQPPVLAACTAVGNSREDRQTAGQSPQRTVSAACALACGRFVTDNGPPCFQWPAADIAVHDLLHTSFMFEGECALRWAHIGSA
jgi:hypothetical protein